MQNTFELLNSESSSFQLTSLKYNFLFRLERDIHFVDLFPSPQPRYKLESDPMCGITTGGREECFWNCEVGSSGLPEGLFKGFLLNPPDCLIGCFSKV